MMRVPDALPLHLMLLSMQSGISPAGWNSWKNPWLNLLRPKTPLEESSEQWAKLWQETSESLSQLASQWLNPSPNQNQRKNPTPKSASVEPPTDLGDFAASFFDPAFLQALAQQSAEQTQRFTEGLQAYLSSDYTPEPYPYRVLWQKGSATLYDLAPDRADGLAVLCVPSLINTSRVLDLNEQASFAQFLKSQGFRPLILDWGSPGDAELNFSTSDYITGYAIAALQELREQHDGPIALVGYCMGGIFTTAIAQLAPLFVDAMVLLATPWDFSAPDTPRVLLEPATQLMLRQWIALMNPVPPMVTQTVFHLIDPWRVQEKYARFPTLDAAAKQHFLALEHWVNDGVPLTQAVAQECFVDWPHGNILATHQWKVGRRWIEPSAIQCPVLAVIPSNDLIVPMGCALPLTREIPRCDVITPKAGHVSMVAGIHAKNSMWKPVADWLKNKF